MPDASYDVLIVGGGIVGLAFAREAQRRFPRLRFAVLEKEPGVGRHQTGHNSGVIHSGIYYKPGSLKAKLCVTGAAEMVSFCREYGIPHEVCGKVIVATEDEQRSRLKTLQERALTNGLVGVSLLGAEELREFEPYARGQAALHVPSTGITDYRLVAEKYAELFQAAGGAVHTGAAALAIRATDSVLTVETAKGAFGAKYLVNCAGLFSDRISKMAGVDPAIRIVPFRGDYYDLVPEKQYLVRNLIYPVPDPRFPFLGVHFTRRITGTVDAGPNAVFAFKREGYARSDISLADSLEALAFPGFWRMARRYWKSGVDEQYRSVRKPAFVRTLQTLVPEIQDHDLVPGGSGVRAQAVARDGSLVDDFFFVPTRSMLHVYNVPSPAASASLAVARQLVDAAASAFGWPSPEHRV